MWVLMGLSLAANAAPEVCNGVDDDGDGAIDEAPLVWYPDVDGDNYGDPGAPIVTANCANPGQNAVTIGTDCNDGDSNVHPGRPEVCNAVDDDCDAVVDEIGCGNSCDRDSDADSHFLFCDRDEDWDDADAWCDDRNYRLASIDNAAENTFMRDRADVGISAFWWIGLEDVANNNWQWADGNTNTYRNWAQNEPGTPSSDNCAYIGATTGTWYNWGCGVQTPYVCKADCAGLDTFTDADGDGFGNPATLVVACTLPAGKVRNDLDCNDGNALDGIHIWHEDADGDGYGDPGAQPSFACIQPSGYVGNADDCDDGDSGLNPGTVWYVDADSDGFGTTNPAGMGCLPQANWSSSQTDCDDTDGAIHPNATEVCEAIPVDNDCNGLSDDLDPGVDLGTGADFWPDQDNDGYGAGTSIRACAEPIRHSATNDDCDDQAPFVFPGAPEQCNGIDDDCDQVDDNDVQFVDWYADADGDGFGDPTDLLNDCAAPEGYVLNNLDCDDGDRLSNPDGIDIPGDGIDQDCVDGDAIGTTTTTEPPTTEPTEPPTGTTPTGTGTDTFPKQQDPTIAVATGCGCDGAASQGHVSTLALFWGLVLLRRRSAAAGSAAQKG